LPHRKKKKRKKKNGLVHPKAGGSWVEAKEETKKIDPELTFE